MKLSTIALSLAALLAAVPGASGAKQMSTRALKAVTGSGVCFPTSNHYCICADWHSDCCPNPNTCTYVDGWYIWQSPISYYNCTTGGTYDAVCDDEMYQCLCCEHDFYLSAGCANFDHYTTDWAGCCATG